MFQGILFVMSLSGSIIIVLYFLLNPVFGQRIPLKNRYFILKMAVFFYLLPVAELKFIVMGIFRKIVHLPGEYLKPGQYIYNMKNLILFDGEIKHYGFSLKWMYFFMAATASISLIMVICQMIRYEYDKKICLRNSHKVENEEYKQMVFSIRQDLNIRRDIVMMSSASCTYPMVMGIRVPVIIFPERCEEIGRQKYIIQHELVHIIHRDLPIKMLAFLAAAIHWYNPLAYLLYYEIGLISELLCDETVVRKMSEDERKDYSNLILDMSADDVKVNKYSIGFISDYTIIKRRILEMKKLQKKKTTGSVLLTALICFSGALTSFAYAPAPIVEDAEWDFQGEMVFSAGVEEPEAMPFACFFTSSEGMISEIEESSEKVVCKHEFQAGTITKHVKNSDGSCTVTEKEAKKCILCNYTKTGDVISVTKYPKCPH